MATKIVAILNCTPDSFSDGTGEVTHARLATHARRLIDDGADILDIGGDSTRPGSECPGVEEEWRRISPLLSSFAHHVPISVDTHHPEGARRAIDCGAAFINDVSGQRAPEMLEVVASSRASYIFMCNPHGAAHTFGDGFTFESALSEISSWLKETIKVCVTAGIATDRLIVDPGMGAFVSSDPRVSWLIAERLGELPHTDGGVLLGCSRKGFLKLLGEMDLDTKDVMSARIGAAAIRAVSSNVPTYLRVHNVARQREAFSASGITMPEWRDSFKQR
jgi:dihydropteroate synthase